MIRVLSVSAETPSGPGWSNRLLHVTIMESGHVQVVTLQPEEWQRSPQLCALYPVLVAMSGVTKNICEGELATAIGKLMR